MTATTPEPEDEMCCECEGSGANDDGPCPECEGSGYVSRDDDDTGEYETGHPVG